MEPQLTAPAVPRKPQRRSGQALVEYAVLLAAVGIGVALAASISSKAFRGQLDEIRKQLVK